MASSNAFRFRFVPASYLLRGKFAVSSVVLRLFFAYKGNEA
jgi:hypothetical protein